MNKTILTLTLLTLAATTQASSFQDLSAWMAETRTEAAKEPIEAIPIIQQAEGRETYDVVAEREPFARPDSAIPPGGKLTKDPPQRKGEPLEYYRLEALHYVGRFQMGGSQFALIQTPEGSVLRVKIGNRVGDNYGEITKIEEAYLALEETVPVNDTTWAIREARLSLR
jgi:type IV pilus assembly protein PilP